MPETLRATVARTLDLWSDNALREAEERAAAIEAAREPGGAAWLDGGEVNIEDFFGEESDKLDRRKVKVKCPACRRTRAPLCSPKTTESDGGMRWVGLDHREPYQRYRTVCACRARYYFTTFIPQ